MTTAAAAHQQPWEYPQVLLDGFLELETPKGFRAELIEGEIVVSPPADGTHEHDISSIVRQVLKGSRVDMDFSGNKGLLLDRGGACPKNYAIPDGVFAPREMELFRGADPWMPCAGVALVLEVTSGNPGRDREVKRICYARGGIPLYLLADRAQQTVTLFSAPDQQVQDYREDVRVKFGHPISLPDPFGFALSTTELA